MGEMSRDWIPLADLTDEDIRTRLAAIVAGSLRVSPDTVTMEASLPGLGAESIDIVEITLDVEHAFTVLMPERSVLQLAGEVSGDDVFEQDGRLTALGSELLRSRMPEIDAAVFVEGTPVRDLTDTLLRIDVWVRLVRGLLAASPRRCPACGGRLIQGAPARVRCPACAGEFDLPSGDELGRAWVRRWLASRPA